MKKVILASLALVAVASLSSCGAKKSAYRKAYEQAKQREVATQATKPAVQYEAPVTTPERAAAPVTVRKERVTTYQGEDANRLKRFSVVVGSFQNPTNARNLKERMVKAGYNAVLATNEVGMLRVIVSSFDSREEAAASRDAIKARFAPDFKDAWLLENAN
ncbi:SPOR domain-containing protein [Porphyromonas sp.]